MSELLPVDDVALKLSSMGLSADFIAAALDRPTMEIKRTVTRRIAVPEDEELAEAMRRLAWVAYRESMNIFEYGTPDQKMSLIRPLITNVSKLIGGESGSALEEARVSFESVMNHMRESSSVGNAGPAITATSQGIDDSDETSDDGTVPD